MAAADGAVEALAVPAVADVLVARFQVPRLVRVLVRAAAPSPLPRALRVAHVRAVPSPRLPVLRLVDGLVAPPVGAVRLAGAVEGAALRRFHSVVSAIGPETRRIRRWSSS